MEKRSPRQRERKHFKFQVLNPAYYLDALLFWAVFTPSTMLILWLLTSTAKDELRETLATQFINSTRQMVDVIEEDPNLGNDFTNRYLQSLTRSYPEIAGVAVAEWSPGESIRIKDEYSSDEIDFSSPKHESFLQRTAETRQVSISDWAIFTREAATLLTPPSRPFEFIYARVQRNAAADTDTGVFLITAYDARVVQHGFYKIEELGITAICISILFGTIIALFVRFRSAQRLRNNEERIKALASLRDRDWALSCIVEAADLLLGQQPVDKVFAELMQKLCKGWDDPVMTAILKNRSREFRSHAQDYRFVGQVPKGDYPASFGEYRSSFPQYWERIEGGEVVVLSRRDAPSIVRRWMQENRITTIVVMGLIQENSIAGILIVGAGEKNSWVSETGVTELMKLTADIFSAAYQQREQEEGMRESSKMEALGRVAGGVAHEFNNLLHIIMGNLRMDADWLDREKCKSRLSRMREAATRGSRIVEQLLEATRLHALDLEFDSLNRVAEQTVTLARPGMGSGITVHLNCSPDLPDTLMDKGQIHQVILNLLLNASHACPTDGGGVINVETGSLDGKIFCEVSDNGTGLNESDMGRLFEPFYTTKEPGHGTGLGLSTSRGILERHGGSIEARNADEGGAIFRFFLPIRQRPAQSVMQRSDPPSDIWLGHSDPVYIVDDEPLCRNVLRDCLEEQNVNVVEFESGDHLLKHLRHATPKPEWIITDWTMPGIHGRELVKKIRENCPDVTLIVTSGFVLRMDDIPEIQGLVTKPFTPEELFEALAAAEKELKFQPRVPEDGNTDLPG